MARSRRWSGKAEAPTPFRDDGQAYLVHGVLGAGPLILHRSAFTDTGLAFGQPTEARVGLFVNGRRAHADVDAVRYRKSSPEDMARAEAESLAFCDPDLPAGSSSADAARRLRTTIEAR